MFDVIAQQKKIPKHISIKGKKIDIHLKEESLDELFRSWLGELLSLSDCEDVIFSEFFITQLTEKELKGTSVGLSRKSFHILREIKAVTYHDLKVGQSGKIFKAEVIFDV